MITSGKTFEELKNALIAATEATPVPRIEINFEQMKQRLAEEGRRYEHANRARAFSTDALMRAYNL